MRFARLLLLILVCGHRGDWHTNAATAAVTIAFDSFWFAFPDAHTLWRIQP
jgi:hypothetical protein